jgi:adenine-specific DNA-methyltransferase
VPTLDWIGKRAVVNHHREVPYRLIHCDKDKSVGDPDAGNLLVQGDNLEALKALLPYYAGKVKCIYIDPPYNTGNETWIYNDNVNSPEIREWLGKHVKKEGEDLSRHDKWLCMMFPRLRLLKDFLSDTGIIFISCDDNEFEHLRIICDEIFGKRNRLANFIWNTEGNTDNQHQIKIKHEYILCYCSNSKFKDLAVGQVVDPNTPEGSNLLAGFADNNITKNGTKNPPHVIELPAGFPAAIETLDLNEENVDEAFFEQARNERQISKTLQQKYHISRIPVRLDPMVIRGAKLTKACRIFSGYANADKLASFIANGCRPIVDGGENVFFYLNRNGCVRYRRERDSAQNILSVLRNLGTTERSKTTIKKMGVDFDYPKPVELISYLLKIGADDQEAIIMDSFAGSGTTGHAVLERISEYEADARFILIEMSLETAQNITAKRLERAVNGYEYLESNGKSRKVAGLGSGFRYCNLGDPLFDEFGVLNPNVTFADLAAHVFFCETGSPIPSRADPASALIGTFQGRAIYLLHAAASLGLASEPHGNVLNVAALESLPLPDVDFRGTRVVYGEGCSVPDERLKAAGVVFKQIPYQLEGL